MPSLPDTSGWPVLRRLARLRIALNGNALSVLMQRFSKAFPNTAEELVKAVQSLDEYRCKACLHPKRRGILLACKEGTDGVA